MRDYAYSRPRQAGESLDTYAADLRKLVNAAFSGDYDYGNDFRNREVLRQFIHGLSSSLRKKCMEQDPENMDAALAFAKRVEFASKFEESQKSAVDLTDNQTSIQAVNSHSEVTELTKMMSDLCTEVKNIKESNFELQDQVKSLSGKTRYPYSGQTRQYDSEMDRRGRDRFRQSPNRSRFRSNSPFLSRRSNSPFRSDSHDFRSDSRRGKSPERYSHFRNSTEFHQSPRRHDSPHSRNFQSQTRYRSPSPPRKRVTFSPSPSRRYYESNSDRYFHDHDGENSGHLNDQRSMMRVNYRPSWRM